MNEEYKLYLKNARKNKDWATADKIRDELKNIGITLEDSPTISFKPSNSVSEFYPKLPYPKLDLINRPYSLFDTSCRV